MYRAWTHPHVPCLDTPTCTVPGHTHMYRAWTHPHVQWLDTPTCTVGSHPATFLICSMLFAVSMATLFMLSLLRKGPGKSKRHNCDRQDRQTDRQTNRLPLVAMLHLDTSVHPPHLISPLTPWCAHTYCRRVLQSHIHHSRGHKTCLKQGLLRPLQHRLGGACVQVEAEGGVCQMGSDEEDYATHCRHIQQEETRGREVGTQNWCRKRAILCVHMLLH